MDSVGADDLFGFLARLDAYALDAHWSKQARQLIDAGLLPPAAIGQQQVQTGVNPGVVRAILVALRGVKMVIAQHHSQSSTFRIWQAARRVLRKQNRHKPLITIPFLLVSQPGLFLMFLL